MADFYICSGAMMKCTMGTLTAQLTVLPTRTVFLTGQPMANISDHLTMVNLAPFGTCRSLGFPATASATAAAQGALTPMPCVHNTPFPWMGGKMDYLVQGQPALLKSSTCQCMWGGTISLITDGQIPQGPANLNKVPKDNYKINQTEKNTDQSDKREQGIADIQNKAVNEPKKVFQDKKHKQAPKTQQTPEKTEEEKKIDNLILLNAYWKKGEDKIKILPFQSEQAEFYLEFYLEHEGDPNYTPKGSEITITFPEIQGTLFKGKEITIKYGEAGKDGEGPLISTGEEQKIKGKKRQIYSYKISGFRPDLTNLK